MRWSQKLLPHLAGSGEAGRMGNATLGILFHPAADISSVVLFGACIEGSSFGTSK